MEKQPSSSAPPRICRAYTSRCSVLLLLLLLLRLILLILSLLVTTAVVVTAILLVAIAINGIRMFMPGMSLTFVFP